MHTYCSHKITLFKLESLCMHFLRAMLYSVDARMLLSNTRQCLERQHKWVIEIAADKSLNQNDMNMLPIVVLTAPNAH